MRLKHIVLLNSRLTKIIEDIEGGWGDEKFVRLDVLLRNKELDFDKLIIGFYASVLVRRSILRLTLQRGSTNYVASESFFIGAKELLRIINKLRDKEITFESVKEENRLCGEAGYPTQILSSFRYEHRAEELTLKIELEKNIVKQIEEQRYELR